MTEEEKAKYRGLLGSEPPKSNKTRPIITAKDDKFPNEAIDWREKGAVNQIVSQGSCGSCWAFAATASIESAYAIKNAKLLRLSEQQMVDCDEKSYGCQGGWYTNAF